MAMSKTNPMLPPPKQTSIARRKLLVLPSGKKKKKVLIIAVLQRWPVVDKTLPANHVHPRLATKNRVQFQTADLPQTCQNTKTTP
jgi:hypothetical protein